MGFAISWVAVHGKSSQQVLDHFGLVRSGSTEEFPEAPLTCATLPSGWFLLFANAFASPLVSDKSLKDISAGCTAVSCQVEEHVMFSSATCYKNEQLTWHTEHDAQKGIYDLVTKGSTPSQLQAIHAASKQQQDEAGGDKADTDYIHDVPVQLAQSITSFRHDQDVVGAGAKPFEVLESTGKLKPPSKPWWKVW
jgi:hypothetical protein